MTLHVPDPEKQDPLVSENEVDPMDREQTLIDDEEASTSLQNEPTIGSIAKIFFRSCLLDC